jgi:hypothetical protein
MDVLVLVGYEQVILLAKIIKDFSEGPKSFFQW